MRTRTRTTYRARRLWLGALATVGLAGAVYAAEQAIVPGDEELERTIAAQRIGEGRHALAASISEHQLEAFSPDQMIQLSEGYRHEMKAAADHIEGVRIEAYRSRDLIRMTCIDAKLTQVGVVIRMADPRAEALTHESEPFTMRAHFSLVRQARDRVQELVADADKCMGEDLGTVRSDNVPAEQSAHSPDPNDPTRPASTIHEADRPPEASPYR